MTTEYYYPTSDVATGSWLRNSGSSGFYSYVDDAVGSPDDDTTYIYGADSVILGCSSPAVPDGSTGLSVKLTHRSKAHSADTFAEGIIRKGTTNYYISNVASLLSGGAYQDYETSPESDPATGLAWTVAGINAITGFGVRELDSSYSVRCTQVFLTVIHTPPAPTAKVFSAPGGAVFVAGDGTMSSVG